MFDSLIDGALDKDLSIIAERCWLKDEEENRDGALTDYLRYLNGEGLIDGGRWRKQFYTNPYKLGKELYQWLQRGSWRPVKEIKKEVTDDIKNTL